MKNKISLFILTVTSFITTIYAQSSSARFQGTITQTTPNSVMIKIRPNETFSSPMTNLQFVLQVPNTVTPRPVVTIKSNPLGSTTPALNYVPTANYILGQVTNEGGFHNYLFAVTTLGAPAYNFISNVEVNALELMLSGVGTTSVRLAQLPDGGMLGDVGQYNFYIETGPGNTNESAMFYGSGASNNPGGYTAYSYVPFAGIVLPIKFTSFSAVKKANDAILTWAVQNESSANVNYEVERSIDGAQFEKINTILPHNNGITNNVYVLNDENIVNLKNNGILYYRIKQVDADGKFVYSEIKNVRLNDKAIFTAFPNPTKDFTTVKIDAAINETVNIGIVNADGKQLYTTMLQLQKGVNLKKIDMSAFASGNYMLKANIEGVIKTIGIIKL